MKEKNKDLRKWADRADYECILAVNNNKYDMKMRDPQASQSIGNQSIEFFKSGYSQAQSISVDNVELQNHSNTLQYNGGPPTIIPPSNSIFDRQSVLKKDSYSDDATTQLKDNENDFGRNVEMNKQKVDYLVKKQNVIFDLYDKLYQKYIQVKRENYQLQLENQRLKSNDPSTREGYISSPMCELKPITEVETESNELTKLNKDQIDLGGEIDILHYDVD